MVIVIVIMIVIDDHSRMPVSVAIPMVVIMIAPIDAESNRYNKWIVIRRIISIVVGWIIGYIHR